MIKEKTLTMGKARLMHLKSGETALDVWLGITSWRDRKTKVRVGLRTAKEIRKVSRNIVEV